MNKTLSIGLAGFSFTIEEHAYIKLNDYLSALRNSLDQEESDEVMHDIELRMVELFKESLGKREVINDGDVEKIMTQIGSPEVIEEQEEAYQTNDKQKKSYTNYGNNIPRQLFRDPENAKMGGVCAGLANYFGMDINWMRVIWALIAIIGLFTMISTFLVIVIYCVLWIVLPQAKTTSDFLKMKGKPVNFDNIKEESGKILDFANESTHKLGEMYQESKPFINKTGSGIWNVFRFFIGGIFGLMGLGLLFSAIAVFGVSLDNDFVDLPGNIQFYLQDGFLKYFGIIFAFLTVFIPSLIFLFISIRLISPKTRLNYTGYVIGGLVFLWIIFLGLFGYKALKYKTIYTGNNEEEDRIAINSTSDSILVDLKKVAVPQNFKSYGDEIYSDLQNIYQEDSPYLEVTHKDGVFAPYLLVKKSADGYNQPLKMEIPVEVVDNKILLPNYFKYPYQYRLRDYDVDYELVVPRNKKVIALNDNLHLSMDDDQDDDVTVEYDSTRIAGDKLDISINDKDKDSITINGKKYHKDVAEKILEKKMPKGLKDLEQLKNINIQIKDDKSNIKIETN